MHLGLILSLLMHAALLAWALFTIQTTPELRPPGEKPIEVALITPSELTRLKKGSLSSTELEAKQKETEKTEQSVKEAEKPKPVTGEIAPPPPPPPDPVETKLTETPPPPPPAPAGPTPEEQQKLAELAAKAEQDRKAEEQKKADEKRKAEEKEKKRKEKEKRDREAKIKKEQDEKNKKSLEQKMAELADKALQDKDPTKRGAANASDPPSKKTDYTGPTAGANQGDDTVLSATEANLLASQLRSQIRSCWKLPGGGGGIETVVVTLSWRMRPDGFLEGEPQVLRPQSDPVYQIAAEAALRAVKACAPYDLPRDKYEFWQFIEEWDFDPKEML